jgi:hypothetical protein
MLDGLPSCSFGRDIPSSRRSRSPVVEIGQTGLDGSLRLDGRPEVSLLETIELIPGCEEAVEPPVLDDNSRINGTCFDDKCSGHGASIANMEWRFLIRKF